MIKRIFGMVFLCCIVFTAAGCGYTTKMTLPSGVSSIFVPNFKNEIPVSDRYTYVSGLEIDVTNAVIDRLLFDGNLKVQKENADAVLYGEIKKYEQEALRYNSIEGVKQYRLFVVASLKLVRTSDEEVIFEEPDFTGDTEYFIEGSNAISQRAAAEKAFDDLAKKIVDRIVEDW